MVYEYFTNLYRLVLVCLRSLGVDWIPWQGGADPGFLCLVLPKVAAWGLVK